VPRPGCFPLERWELERGYPAAGAPGIVYSNVNSAARRGAWEEVPFDEGVSSAEDRLWALAQAERGRRIAYVPEAAVLHSHTYSLREVFRRCRADAAARRHGEGARDGLGLLILAWPRTVLADARRLSAEGAGSLWPRAAAYRFAQYAGIFRGGRG
jgi:rhamnosyltransferase